MPFDLLNTATNTNNYATTTIANALAAPVSFITSVVTQYWGTILSVLFVMGMIGLFWNLGRMIVGR